MILGGHQDGPQHRHRRRPDAAGDAGLGARRKHETVELGQRTQMRLQQQGEIRAFRGRLHWEASVLCAKTTSSLINLAHPCCSVVIGIGW